VYKYGLIILVVLYLGQGCQTPKQGKIKEVKMNFETKYFTRYKDYNTEKFDVEAYDERVRRNKFKSSAIDLEDGTAMRFSKPIFKEMIYGREETVNGSIKIVPAYPALYRVSKYYHAETKILISQGISIGSQMVGVFQKFNKYGKLIQEIDIEKKDWSKYHYRDVLKFLDEKKIINLKTGEGRGTFDFYLDENNGTATWIIEEIENDKNRWIRSKYTVNANTMEVLKLEKEQRGIE